LHLRVCDEAGHPLPPLAAFVLTVRLRIAVPEHLCPFALDPAPVQPALFHAAQLFIAQLTLQPCVLHFWLSESFGHAVPPLAALVLTVRLRVCVPLPQDFVHMPHLPQLFTAQLTLQLCVLHFLLSESFGHAVPPCTAFVLIVRLRVCVPLPQDFVHLPHLPQPFTAQLALQPQLLSLDLSFWHSPVPQ